MTRPAVVTSRRGATLVVEIARPEARNAINLAVAQGLRAAIDELDADASLAVGVLTGAGGTFSAGMDLKAFAAGEIPEVTPGGFAGITELPPRKPLIAAVEGWALAGGLELVLACDLAVASETARFGIPEVKVGLVADSGGLVKLPRRVPYSVAMRMALTGDPITAAEALDHGLVVEVTAPGAALDAALALAEVVSRGSPNAVRVTKQVLEASATWPNRDWAEAQRPLVAGVTDSADAKEGARAFVEKREPRWSGEGLG